jgi:hypothetical protein
MTIDFKYDPLTGAIAGPDFIDQTERAFNELGTEIETVNQTAQEAKDIGNAALISATEANLLAGDAITKAENAQGSADGAQASSNNAQISADNAQATANSAYDLAALAETKAETAQDTADSGLTLATQADTKADTAQTSANDAQVIANSAYSLADIANGLFRTQQDDDNPLTVDANTQTEVNKLYLVRSDTTNIPLAVPCYLMVYADDSTQTVTQFCWSAVENGYWIRTGLLSASGDSVTATWGDWIKFATTEDLSIVNIDASQITSGTIDVDR